MRTTTILASGALCAMLASGCAAPEPTEPEIGDTQSEIIGGVTAPGDHAVVMLSIGCTGTLIRPNIVLTAAHCLPGGTVYFGPKVGEFYDTRRTVESIGSRYYGAGLAAGGDIALLRLDEDAPIDVLPIDFNIRALTEDDVNATIRTVGYGNDDGEAGTGFGTKRQVTHSLLGITDEFIVTGTADANTCQGDSGGPTFMMIDGREQVIAVTSFGEGGCLGISHQTRTDVYQHDFLDVVINAWYGECSKDGMCNESCSEFIDPDCDTCALDGVCATGCAKKDLDCPLSGRIGELCQDREGCESLTCVTSYDDDRVNVCSTECDPDDTSNNFGCELPLTACVDDGTGAFYCQYSGPTPSTQGADCDDGSDCRSGMCDTGDKICVELCSGADTCGDAFVCSDIGNGQSACLLPKDGGGCSARGGRDAPAGALILLGIAVLGVAGVRRRRRRA